MVTHAASTYNGVVIVYLVHVTKGQKNKQRSTKRTHKPRDINQANGNFQNKMEFVVLIILIFITP
jgi:hypothetical protein